MYGGLFGDLPAAKKKPGGGPSSGGNQNDDDAGGVSIGKDKATASPTTIATKSVQVPNSNAPPGTTTDDKSTSAQATGQGTNWLFPSSRKRPKPNNAGSVGMGKHANATATPTATETARGNATTTERNSATTTTTTTTATASNTVHRPTGQILKGLGTAGTSMAFVPTATLHKRKRFLPNGAPAPPTMKPVAPSTTNNSNNNKNNNNNNPSLSPSLDPTAPAIATVVPATTFSQQQQSQDSTGATARTLPATTTTTGISWISSDLVTRHDKDNDNDNSYHQSSAEADNANDERYNDNEYDDDEAAEDIEDPYDPLVPNDLLQYWERKALAHERLELEREAKEAMEQQEMIRRELERKREELRQTGDYHQLLLQNQQPRGGTGTGGGNEDDDDTAGGVFGYGGLGASSSSSGGAAMGRGRGRGRGLSNLPAWLVEKQRIEREREQQLGAMEAGGVGTNVHADNTSNQHNDNNN